jgi:hypothetical protein
MSGVAVQQTVDEARRRFERLRVEFEEIVGARKPISVFDWVAVLAEPADKLVAEGWTRTYVAAVLCDIIGTEMGQVPSHATVLEYRRRLDIRLGMTLRQRLQAYGFDPASVRDGTRFTDILAADLDQRFANSVEAGRPRPAAPAAVPPSAGPTMRRLIEHQANRAAGRGALHQAPVVRASSAASSADDGLGSVTPKPQARPVPAQKPAVPSVVPPPAHEQPPISKRSLADPGAESSGRGRPPEQDGNTSPGGLFESPVEGAARAAAGREAARSGQAQMDKLLRTRAPQ